MAEITTGAPIQMPTPPAAPAPTVLQKIETAVFAFLQAHYSKLAAAIAGYAAAKGGIFGFFGRFF